MVTPNQLTSNGYSPHKHVKLVQINPHRGKAAIQEDYIFLIIDVVRAQTIPSRFQWSTIRHEQIDIIIILSAPTILDLEHKQFYFVG